MLSTARSNGFQSMYLNLWILITAVLLNPHKEKKFFFPLKCSRLTLPIQCELRIKIFWQFYTQRNEHFYVKFHPGKIIAAESGKLKKDESTIIKKG